MQLSLIHIFPPPQVGLLVEKDVGPVLGVQPHGEVDFRGENTADKGGGNLIGLIEVALQPDGFPGPPAQTEVGNAPPKEHAQGAGPPESDHHIGPVRPGGGPLVCRAAGVRRGRRLGAGGGLQRLPSLLHVGALGDGGGDQAHGKGEAHRTDHADKDHHPQQTGDPPGRPFQMCIRDRR